MTFVDGSAKGLHSAGLGLSAALQAMFGIQNVSYFCLPADDMFLPLLRRWKTRCSGCGVQSTLGCYDLTVPCQNEEGKINGEGGKNKMIKRS
jgi:hypothetical protein